MAAVLRSTNSPQPIPDDPWTIRIQATRQKTAELNPDYTHDALEALLTKSTSSFAPSSPELEQSLFSRPHSYTTTAATSLSLDTKGFLDDDDDIPFPSFEPYGPHEREELMRGPFSITDKEPTAQPANLPREDAGASSIIFNDDQALEPEPTRHVDYLTYEWKEEDIWSSWRFIVARRKLINNSVRLENASWRAWAKMKYNLKTISPETLHWLKDCDVTWLYGPLQTTTKKPFNTDGDLGAKTSSHIVSNTSSEPLFKPSNRDSVEIRRFDDEEILTLTGGVMIEVEDQEQHESVPILKLSKLVSTRAFELHRPAHVVTWKNTRAFAETLFTRYTMLHSSKIELHFAESSGSTTAGERMKRRIESHLHCKVLWWPLEAPRTECGPGQKKISWNCNCGAALNVNISIEHAGSFYQKMRLASQVSNQPPLLPTYQAQASQCTSTASRNAQLNTKVSSHAVPVSVQGPGNNAIQIAPWTALVGASNPGHLPEKFLHWCIKGHTATTRVVEIEMKDLKDETFVPRLLATYNSINRFRSWLTLTSCV